MLEIGNPAHEWQINVVHCVVTNGKDNVQTCVLDTFCPLGSIGLLANAADLRAFRSAPVRPASARASNAAESRSDQQRAAMCRIQNYRFGGSSAMGAEPTSPRPLRHQRLPNSLSPRGPFLADESS